MRVASGFLSMFNVQCYLCSKFQLRTPPPLSSGSISMALRHSTPNSIIPRDQTKKAVMRASVLPNKQITPKASVPLIRSCMHIKIYEDKAMGIICYKDEKGEVICEGYDEGPRYSRPPQEEEHQERQKELQIPSFLQAVKPRYAKEDPYFCQVVRDQW
ncbi:hypothetical protein MUK42_16341 [Musa troglodytarum]|uniref:Uncharacterized protein n=2 Tax=Musa troglodytarum TaxID=320322 RepID=A0A9E7KPV9_9LILI|nr:hypothetical protein MUK42_16341 [Musa troglodytarum]